MPRLLSAADPATYLPVAIEILGRGGVVALPTETVYGLAASPFDPAGVGRVFSLKGRPVERPLPLLAASLAAVRAFGLTLTAGACRLAARFWPGPLTLVLDRPPGLPPWFAPGSGTIAVRVPDHPVALALLAGIGFPLAVTSANPSGRMPALEASEVLAAFPGADDLLVLDGGRSPGGEASTVVDGRGPLPSILRRGPIFFESLREAWGP